VVRWPDLGADTTALWQTDPVGSVAPSGTVTFLFHRHRGIDPTVGGEPGGHVRGAGSPSAPAIVGPPRASGDSICNHGRLAAESEKCSLGLLLRFLTLRAGPVPTSGGKPPVR